MQHTHNNKHLGQGKGTRESAEREEERMFTEREWVSVCVRSNGSSSSKTQRTRLVVVFGRLSRECASCPRRAEQSLFLWWYIRFCEACIYTCVCVWVWDGFWALIKVNLHVLHCSSHSTVRLGGPRSRIWLVMHVCVYVCVCIRKYMRIYLCMYVCRKFVV